jgi:glycosyltransferase involved in cell wall biosynthesis
MREAPALYLLVAWDFVRTGGMDMANYALASYLADAGSEVHLLAASASDDLTARPNVHFHSIRKLAGSYFLSAPILDNAGRRLAARISREGGRVLVNGGNCSWGDVNWVHYVHAAYEPAVEGNAICRAKWYLAHRWFLREERVSLDRAKVVIANSHRTKRDLVERLGLPANRIHTVYLGIDPDKFHPLDPSRRKDLRTKFGWPDDLPILAFVGGLGDRRKGFDTVFKAWQTLRTRSNWKARLVVVGRGSELQSWQLRVHSAGLAEQIHFLGFREDVPDILGACDALISPTRYESFGLGVLEALCCGLPGFVTNTAGVAECYPESLRHLLLSDPNSSEELALKLQKWSDCRDEYRAAVLELSGTLRQHTWTTMAARIASIIECN